MFPMRAGLAAACMLLLLAACSDDDASSNNTTLNNQAQLLCGNGQQESPEECDDGTANSDSRPDACRTDCTLARCGDGVQDTGEPCDSGPANQDDVPDTCRTDCILPRCGDGVVDVLAGELCDDGGVTPGDGCSATCLVEYCGNGILDPGEACDDGNYVSGDGCNPDCQSTCGDGVLDAGEVCDTHPIPTWSCLDFGFDSGQIGCSEYCTPGFSGCDFLGWKAEPSGTTASLQGVFGTAQDDVWAVGYGGTAVHFDGQVWTPVSTPSGEDLLAVWGSATDDVWAVGSAGTVLRWNGSGWSLVTVPTSVSLRALWVSGPDDVWVGGDQYEVLHWNGTDWSTRSVGAGSSIRAIWGTSPTNVIVASQGGWAYHYNGTSWQGRNVGAFIPRVFFGHAPNDVYLAGNASSASRIHHFNGSQWTSLPVNIGYLSAFHGIGDHLWAGSSTLSALSNEAWRIHQIPSEAYNVQAMWSAHADHAVAVGGYGTIVRYYRGSWSIPLSVGATPRALRGLTRGPDGSVYSGSDDPEPMWRFRDGVWAAVGGTSNTDGYTDVWVSPSNVIWAAGIDGDSPVVVRYSGTTPVSQPLDTTLDGGLESIWGASDTSIFAVGRMSTILRFNGTSWTQQTGNGDILWNKVWGASATQVFVVGQDLNDTFGYINMYDGSTWTPATIPAGTPPLVALGGSGGTDVFAVGFFGTILHYDGVAWTTMPSPTTVRLDAIWANATNDVFAAGRGGVLLHFDGTRWSKVRSSTGDNLRALVGVGDSLYALGDVDAVYELLLTGVGL